MRNLILPILLLISIASYSQKTPSTYVDASGTIRWSANKREVSGFGVNYTLPFAHAYRTAKKLGIDPRQAIEEDLYHMKRLGFDLYRIHIWDTEISDTLGNLVYSDNLDLFDYMIKRLNDYEINYVLTPIAFWGNGWPEPNQESPGFSEKYGKDECLTNPACISAQEKYLENFMNHVNPYTKQAYKEDPRLLAIEVSNEPHHRGKEEEVKKFVEKMVTAIKKSGTQIPIFYNGSHAVHFTQAYFDGGVQGGTFQWYPTGLGYQKEIPGNLLPNVSKYHIPFDPIYKKNGGAKIVYEFDAADVGKSYIYPAMARSFRESGIQLATHFSYDPTFMAAYNTEYNTHYMNLAYTPAKAIALMISAEVFRKIPLYKDWGHYPQNNAFGDFMVNYENDLAIYNHADKLLYSNSHKYEAKNESKLVQIAGTGSSPLVKYEGNGAYFLDKIAPGLWRLEVMPDALWVDNPFGRNSTNKTVGVLSFHERKMSIHLKEFQSGFSVQGINEGNGFSVKSENNTVSLKPGTYIISANSKVKKWKASDAFMGGKLSDFKKPGSKLDRAYLLHEPLQEHSEKTDLEVKLKFVSPNPGDQLELIVPGIFRQEKVFFEEYEPFHYRAIIPGEKINPGMLSYYILLHDTEGKTISFPSIAAGHPYDWDFHQRNPYQTKIVPAAFPIHLFDAKTDADQLVRQWRRGMQLSPTQHANEWEYQIKLDKLFVEDPENLGAEPIYDYTFKHFILDHIHGRRQDLKAKQKIIIKARSLETKDIKLQIALVMDNGAAFGGMITVSPKIAEYSLDLSTLGEVATVTLPRPYPSFLPYFFVHQNKDAFDISRIESIQISIGPGLSEEEKHAAHALGLISIRLE